MNWRWENCVWSQGASPQSLVDGLAGDGRHVLLIGGAGFDPRASRALRLLQLHVDKGLRVLLLREQRPRPDRELLERADHQLQIFRESGVELEVIEIDVFSVDGAPVGGREAVARLDSRSGYEEFTDIVVDFSALSLGVSFPVTRYLFELAEQIDANLHVIAVDSPDIDARISSTPTDKATPVHGCSGEWGLDGTSEATKLWLPSLVESGRTVLERIYRTINPDDTCPVIPFPCRNPHRGDRLLLEYREEIESNWRIGSQNIIYAAELDPIDLYRSILRVDDVRRRVFKDLGGSLTILSPLGTKVMALGAFMAAVERDLPVFYVEAHGYGVQPDLPYLVEDGVELVHVWLAGEPYRERSPDTTAPSEEDELAMPSTSSIEEDSE